MASPTHPGEPNVNLVLLNVTVQTPKDGFCVRGDNVMRRITVLAAAGAFTVAVGVISFTLGRALTVREPATPAMLTKVAEPVLVTGTIASRAIPVQVAASASAIGATSRVSTAREFRHISNARPYQCRRRAEPTLQQSRCARRLPRGGNRYHRRPRLRLRAI